MGDSRPQVTARSNLADLRFPGIPEDQEGPAGEHAAIHSMFSPAVPYIVSENLRRRHLNTGQLAILALRVERHYAEIAKARQAEAARRDRTLSDRSRSDAEVPANRPEPSERRQHEAREQAVRAVGTSGRSVQRAKTVERAAPHTHGPDAASGVRF